MRTDVAKRSKKAGLPPGTLLHVGERRAGQVKVSVIEYDKGWFTAKGITASGLSLESKRRPAVRWIDVEGLHQVDVIRNLGTRYSIHSLVLEDILQTAQRPKIEDFGDLVFVVLKMLRYDRQKKAVESEQVSIILKKNTVLTFQEGTEGDVFDSIRHRIRNDGGLIRSLGTDYLVYSLMDAIVDQYFVILEELGERIELAERGIIDNPTTKELQEVQRLKHELLFVRKSIWSLREVVAQLERGDSPLIRRQTIAYLRDLHDHVITTMETLESYRETLSGLVDLAMSSMSNRMNEVMKTLTVIATIFIPLTFIVGVYGMNFDTTVSPWSMPELKWPFGYPAILLIMGVSAFAMLAYFKRRKWF
jgi:magnesium transporter